MTIKEMAFAGLPLNCPVIDAHTHITEDYYLGWHQYEKYTSVGDTLGLCARVGIDAIVTAPHHITIGYMSEANRAAELAARDFPGQVYCYISVLPEQGVEAIRKEIDTYAKNPAFLGLKFLGGYHGHYLMREYQYALAFADEAACPVLCHTWENNPPIDDYLSILEDYPRAKIITAHLGGGSERWTRRAAEIAAMYENFYIETCGAIYTRLSMDDVAALIDTRRIIFGTDAINLDPKFDFGKLAFSDIPDGGKRDMLAGNYLRLLEGSQLGRIELK